MKRVTFFVLLIAHAGFSETHWKGTPWISEHVIILYKEINT